MTKAQFYVWNAESKFLDIFDTIRRETRELGVANLLAEGGLRFCNILNKCNQKIIFLYKIFNERLERGIGGS